MKNKLALAAALCVTALCAGQAAAADVRVQAGFGPPASLHGDPRLLYSAPVYGSTSSYYGPPVVHYDYRYHDQVVARPHLQQRANRYAPRTQGYAGGRSYDRYSR